MNIELTDREVELIEEALREEKRKCQDVFWLTSESKWHVEKWNACQALIEKLAKGIKG